MNKLNLSEALAQQAMPEILKEQKWIVYNTKTGKEVKRGIKKYATAKAHAEKGDDLKVASDEWWADNKDTIAEGIVDTLKRKAGRLKQKASRAFWWDGHVSPAEMKQKIATASEEELIAQSNGLDDATLNKQNAFYLKLITRELKQRFGVSPQGNEHAVSEEQDLDEAMDPFPVAKVLSNYASLNANDNPKNPIVIAAKQSKGNLAEFRLGFNTEDETGNLITLNDRNDIMSAGSHPYPIGYHDIAIRTMSNHFKIKTVRGDFFSAFQPNQKLTAEEVIAIIESVFKLRVGTVPQTAVSEDHELGKTGESTVPPTSPEYWTDEKAQKLATHFTTGPGHYGGPIPMTEILYSERNDKFYAEMLTAHGEYTRRIFSFNDESGSWGMSVIKAPANDARVLWSADTTNESNEEINELTDLAGL